MKRLHVHVSVADIDKAIQFYNALFASKATVVKDDYAKWLLDDPAVNFAVSNHSKQLGLSHLGLQVDSDDQLEEISSRLSAAGIDGLAEEDAQCCYANSNKYWTKDPAQIPWENFHTMGEISHYYGPDEKIVKAESSGEHCCS